MLSSSNTFFKWGPQICWRCKNCKAQFLFLVAHFCAFPSFGHQLARISNDLLPYSLLFTPLPLPLTVYAPSETDKKKKWMLVL